MGFFIYVLGMLLLRHAKIASFHFRGVLLFKRENKNQHVLPCYATLRGVKETKRLSHVTLDGRKCMTKKTPGKENKL